MKTGENHEQITIYLENLLETIEDSILRLEYD